MNGWTIRHTICGLAELDAHGSAGMTHLVSILDPGEPEPGTFYWQNVPERLTRRFHDAIVPHPDFVLPARADVEAILAFGRTVPDGDLTHLVVHCHMGISRSTAATAALMLQAQPDADEDAVFATILAHRPKAWPNSLMIRHADALLGRDGRFIEALGRLYRRQLLANPAFADPLRNGGRIAEVEMAERAALG